VVKINNGARTKKLNEPLFLEFDVVENWANTYTESQ
jgi:hypothetical protein